MARLGDSVADSLTRNMCRASAFLLTVRCAAICGLETCL